MTDPRRRNTGTSLEISLSPFSLSPSGSRFLHEEKTTASTPPTQRGPSDEGSSGCQRKKRSKKGLKLVRKDYNYGIRSLDNRSELSNEFANLPVNCTEKYVENHFRIWRHSCPPPSLLVFSGFEILALFTQMEDDLLSDKTQVGLAAT